MLGAATLAVTSMTGLALLPADNAATNASASTSGTVGAGSTATAAQSATATTTPTTTPVTGVELDLTVDNLGMVPADKNVTGTATVRNDASVSAGSGTITVTLTSTPLENRGALDTWLDPGNATDAKPSSQEPPAVRTVTTITTGAVSNGVSTFPFSISPAILNLSEIGVFGLEATFASAGATLAHDRTSIVAQTIPTDSPNTDGQTTDVPVPSDVLPADPARRVNLTVALPLTAPAGTTGLIPAALLDTYTGPEGALTVKLDAALRRPVAIGLDPMILASIRILGNSAPASAQSWLARLQNAPNEVFELSYADADLAVQAQAGVGLLKPTSLAYGIDDSLFTVAPSRPLTPTSTNPTSTNPPSDTPTADTPAAGTSNGGSTPLSPSPTQPEPTPTDGQPDLPTLKSLTAWSYTATGIGWPADGTVTTKDLAVFKKDGIDTTILSGTNVVKSATSSTSGSSTSGTSTSDPSSTPGAHATVSGHSVLVADGDVTRALRTAAAAETDQDWAHAMAELSAQLALISDDAPGDAPALLAAFGRNVLDLGRFGQTIDALRTVPWVASATLAQAMAAPANDVYAVKDSPESKDRVTAVTELHARASQVADLATVVKQPELITGNYRADLLALLAASWLDNPVGWAAQVETSLTASQDLLEDVRLAPMSDVQMYAGQASIPVTVVNDLVLPVTVRVQTLPLNGRLSVDDDVTAVVEAQSQAKILVPVKARVANGDVTLRVSLFNDDMSVTLDGPDFISVAVHADWETFGTLLLAVLIVGFFGFGVWRNISKRRRKRTADVADATATAADTGTPAASPASSSLPVMPDEAHEESHD